MQEKMQRFKVLIVDDEEDLRTTYASFLSLMDYLFTISEASNGNEAFDLCQQHQFDIIITDLIMPNEDGASFISRLLAHSHKQNLIVLSAGLDSEFTKDIKSFGVTNILAKPCSAENFINVINKIIDQLKV